MWYARVGSKRGRVLRERGRKKSIAHISRSCGPRERERGEILAGLLLVIIVFRDGGSEL